MRKVLAITMALVLASCGNTTSKQQQPSEKPMKTYYPPATKVAD
jgi:hypothetical protein